MTIIPLQSLSKHLTSWFSALGRQRGLPRCTEPLCAVAICYLLISPLSAAATGIKIQPNEEGVFEYSDDFQTPTFLKDAFVTNYRAHCWSPGSLKNEGPHNWSLDYRFHSDRLIDDIDVQIDQSANGSNLGGSNTLLVSKNGLDWKPVMSSSQFEADRNGHQEGTMTLSPELKTELRSGSELWLRLQLGNYSGLSTRTSSSIGRVNVTLTLRNDAVTKEDTQTVARKTWGQLRTGSNWRDISLDAADPAEHRAPHYYEDMDGWLRAPGTFQHLLPDDAHGFPIWRTHGSRQRHPLSLVSFIQTEQDSNQLILRVIARSTQETSRQLTVAWNGQVIGTHDAASYFDKDTTFYVRVPNHQKKGRHEIRITGADRRPVLIRQVAVAGTGKPRWATKPILSQGGELELLDAYYMGDPAPPPASQVVEGRHKTQEIGLVHHQLQRMYEEHTDFGALRIVLRNTTEVPVRIGDRLILNGQFIDDHYVDFRTSAWDARGVVWYRVRPQLVAAGQCAQVYIRFRRRPAGDAASITIPVVNGDDVDVRIPYQTPAVAVDYVTTDASMKRLYVYARRDQSATTSRVTGLSLNGQRLPNTAIHGADFPGTISLLTSQLPRALQAGEYHVVTVHTDDGRSTAAQFRVMRFFYPRSSIHVPTTICQEMNMNLVMWHLESLQECEKHDIYNAAGTDTFSAHQRVLYLLGPDEPDAHDNRGGGHYNGLGATARELAHAGWHQLIERFSPQAASWLIMNGTTRPLNWSVYGQLADISCFDPYPCTYYGADHAYVRESLLLARRCGAPQRMFGCMEAFGWGKGQGVPAGARGPSPAEYRQNIVQAIGSGMKGLTSWVYVSGAGGWELDDACRQEIAQVNKLIQHIENELLLGTPIDLASTDAGQTMTGIVSSNGNRDESWPKQRVWAGALLSGPDAMVIAVAHHIPASKPDPPVIDPARDVTITVTLPDFLNKVKAFEVTPEGLTPFPVTIQPGTALLKLEAIESGRVFVLRRT